MTAVLIVALACGATMMATGQSLNASKDGVTKTRANLLAQDLMNEISACRWSDPSQPSHWGLESGEDARTRAQFDDIDDYDGWSGPPQTRDGLTYGNLQRRLFPEVTASEYDAYTCTVHVQSVTADGQPLADGSVSRYRKVTVTVLYDGQTVQELTQIFQDHSVLLSRQHWFQPNAVQSPLSVQVVP
jgi:hypothetical protein